MKMLSEKGCRVVLWRDYDSEKKKYRIRINPLSGIDKTENEGDLII